MKVSIDKSKCIDCATCVGICPEVFEIKDDGTVEAVSYTHLTLPTIYSV